MPSENNMDNINLFLAIAGGVMVAMMVGTILYKLVPGSSPKLTSGIADIGDKPVRELVGSDMTTEQLIRSIWKLENKMKTERYTS